MLKFNIYSKEGKIVGEKTLPKEIFGLKLNLSADELIYEAVKMYQANKRQGTASTKTRGEVKGGGRKPRVQKHTGRARAGSIRSPLWTGGGTTFGPKPRNYSYKMPKKKIKLALFFALSYKAKDGKILLLDKLNFAKPPKTKLFKSMLIALGINSGKRVLFAPLKIEDIPYRAGRNINQVRFMTAKDLNALDVLHSETIVFTLDGLKSFIEIRK
ncbi:50S ribosomal protein L4 [candidate division WOR-3 bacterium]|nr:50S ribosomal protein L4 [candidate division WOR-3 bacterium]